jgi:hypothetical protein
MLRTLCVWLAVAALATTSACDSDNGGTGGTGGSAATGGGGGSTTAGGSGGSTGGTGGSATGGSGGAGTDARDAPPLDLAAGIDFAPPSDAQYDAAAVPSTIPLDRAPAVFADVICEKIFSCCSTEERGTSVFLSSQMNCAGGLGILLSQIVPQATTAMSKNRAMYDPTVLAACLQQYQSRSCTQLRMDGGLSAYRNCKFITPLVPVGGACDQHLECIDGYCLGVLPMADGACAAKKANGQQCFQDDECSGGFCNKTTGTCAAANPDGLCTALRF